MGLTDFIRSQFIDIIEWQQPTDRGILAFRFPRHNNEIKMGAKLVVRESQTAIFVNEGKLADTFGPGTHTLSTQNLPILATLKGWKYGFESPFKAEVYFVATRFFTDLKWGTMNPIMLRDPEFGPIRLRAFGTYTVKVKDPNAITVAVLLRLSGILEGYVLLYFPYSASLRLLQTLSGKKVTDLRALDKYDRSIFQEVGNVLTGGMLKGLSQFLHIELMQSVPDVVIDMGGAMFNSISAAMIHQHNEFLALDVAICVDAEPGSISCKDGQEAVGNMYLFLGPEAADTILKLTNAMISPSHE